MAAKKTPDLIPLCHPILINDVIIEFDLAANDTIGITATVKSSGKTGVETEALVATSAAALTIYDMAKAIDKGMTISEIYLKSKTGGKSGTYRREEA
jgi:cyclic pyranopterin phosphate synthase